jgi:putative membrane protein
MKVSMFAGVAALLFSVNVSAQDSTSTTNQDSTRSTSTSTEDMGTVTKVGKMSVAAFNALNEKGSKMVAAIKPTKTALSAADKKLMLQVAAGGQRQLALSQAVLDKVTNPQVKLLAQSEVEEQTGVAAKLKEIADAKNITLPEGPDAAVQAMVGKVDGLSGGDLDAFYINESGVNGHVLLQKTMTTVNANAKDPALKKLAVATLPVIRTHLTISRDMKQTMGTNASAGAMK